jgi:hypothetical protein
VKFVQVPVDRSVYLKRSCANQHSSPERKDQAEYNAYMTALNTQDHSRRRAAMETFVQQYPNSVVSVDVLDQAMAAYQQAKNQVKVEDTANRLLQFDARNVRAELVRRSEVGDPLGGSYRRR